MKDNINLHNHLCLSSSTNRGFTLIEFLVVIAIISIFSVLTLVNYRTGEKNLALQRSASKLSQDLRRAQEMAMSVKEFTNPSNPQEKVLPRGGYGVYFGPLANSNSYIIFADCNNNKQFDQGNVCGPSPKFSEKIEEIKLESKIQIQSFSPSPLHITFSPPDPTTNIYNINDSEAVIILSNNLQTTTIKINKAGLIYVE